MPVRPAASGGRRRSTTKAISTTCPGTAGSVTPRTVAAGRWTPKYLRPPSDAAAAFRRTPTMYTVRETI